MLFFFMKESPQIIHFRLMWVYSCDCKIETCNYESDFWNFGANLLAYTLYKNSYYLQVLNDYSTSFVFRI